MTDVTDVQGLPIVSSYRDDSPYLTQEKAAKYLHVSERTLERLRHEGGGPRYRKAGRRVLPDAVREFGEATISEIESLILPSGE